MTVKEFKQEIHNYILELLDKESLKGFFMTTPLIIANTFVMRLQEAYLKRFKEYNLQRDFHFVFEGNIKIVITTKNDKKQLTDFQGISDSKAEKAYIEGYKTRIETFFKEKILTKASFIELKETLLRGGKIINNENLLKESPKEHLRLLDITIKNYQAIKEASITNLPADTKWIFLTGENGFGKTSVLRAIALGLCGFESYNPKKDKMPSIEVKVLADTEEKTIQLTYTPQSPPILPNVIGYGASRLNAVGEEGNSKASNPIGYLFETVSYLKNIELQLSRWFFKKDEIEFETKYLKTVETLKTLLAKNITDIKVNEKTDVVYYKERYADESEEYLTFDQLASGYKGLINLAGDIILRLFEQQPEVHNPAELVGIVIIDELDLHLHPKIQRVLPTLLSDCFPKIQFIVSTHSPIPILGAPKESVFLKVTRTKEEGIKIINLDHIAVRNLTPNTILTSPFFDFDDIIAEGNTSLTELRTEETYREVIFNQVLEEKLKELGSNSKFSQLFASE